MNDTIAVGTQARVMAKNAVAMGGNVSYTGLNNDPYGVTRFTTIYGEINNSGVTIQNGPSMTAADGFKYGVSTINDTGLTVGNATVQDNKIAIDGGPSMTKEGVNAGGQKITNVANGDVSANSTDAVNGGQLYSAIDNVNHDISNVDNRARKGIAGAAALAALHPMEFDPDDKVDLPLYLKSKPPPPSPIIWITSGPTTNWKNWNSRVISKVLPAVPSAGMNLRQPWIPLWHAAQNWMNGL